MLKGLLQVEGGSNTAASGTTADDFRSIPYLAFKGDYSATSTVAQTLVDAIKGARGNGGLYPVGPARSVAGFISRPLRK